ncbi:hypothetical protein Aperf_G00000111582 [Anoplocephala perfoliata]
MGDSEDDNSMRKSRDKFRRERSDAENRRDKREPFDERAGYFGTSRSRSDRRSSFVGSRDRSTYGEQPTKRPRREWNDDIRQSFRTRDVKHDAFDDEANYRPPLKPFKRFLEPLDDFITDEEAVAKYKEYKEAFNRQYITEFFEAHKNEEWLREKYHPDFIDETREQISKSIRHRLDIFLDLFDKGLVENQPVEMENSKNLTKLMDAVIVKLNGGNDDDLIMLDKMEVEEDERKSVKERRSRLESGPRSEGEESDFYTDDDYNLGDSLEQGRSKSKSSKSKATESNDWTGISSDSDDEKKAVTSKNDQEEEEDYGGDAKESVGEEEHASPTSSKEEASTDVKGECDESSIQKVASNGDFTRPKAEEGSPSKQPTLKCSELHKNASIFFRSLPPSMTRKELEEICSEQPGFIRLAISDPLPERRFLRRAWATYNGDVDIKKICWALNTSPLLREKWPQSKDSDELCATVNRELNQRIRTVNGVLTRHKPVMQNDLRVASRLVAQLDAKHSLWSLPGEEEDSGAVTRVCPVPGLPGVMSSNPLMRNLTDFFAEEATFDRNSNLGTDMIGGDGDKTASCIPLNTDASLLRALDRLIIYLRIVYSVDFYAATLYNLEDLMPHQCGIFHVRDTIEGRTSGTPTVFQYEVNDYISNFNAKIANMLDMPRDLTDAEIEVLGARNPEKAAEEFIEANIQKRTSKKKPCKVVWVCPLSDKKFREPIFVRKHILNKHMDKVETAKKDNAIFFNNYLRDPKRPSLPEAPRHLISRYYPPSVPIGDAPVSRGRNFFGNYRSGGGFRGGFRPNSGQFARRDYAALDTGHNPMGGGFYGSRGASPRGGFKSMNTRKRPYPDEVPRPGGRSVISYNDLDDPGNEGF